jgi:hypothetical protein
MFAEGHQTYHRTTIVTNFAREIKDIVESCASFGRIKSRCDSGYEQQMEI